MVEHCKKDESCRLCDEIGGQMFNIFEKNEDGYQILQVIKECLPIIVSTCQTLRLIFSLIFIFITELSLQIYRTDPLSKQICEGCYINVSTLHKFKKSVQEIAEKQKKKLTTYLVSSHEELPLAVRLFLACGEEVVSTLLTVKFNIYLFHNGIYFLNCTLSNN